MTLNVYHGFYVEHYDLSIYKFKLIGEKLKIYKDNKCIETYCDPNDWDSLSIDKSF